MTSSQPSNSHERLHTARADLRAAGPGRDGSGLVAPQLRASVVQLQADMATAKAALRRREHGGRRIGGRTRRRRGNMHRERRQGCRSTHIDICLKMSRL